MSISLTNIVVIYASFCFQYATKYRQLIPPEHWTDAPISFCQAGSVRATIDGFYSSGNHLLKKKKNYSVIDIGCSRSNHPSGCM